MQNTYQEKIADLEANSAPVRKKLEGGIKFRIKSSFKPSGDQPEAIKKIRELITSSLPEDIEELKRYNDSITPSRSV